MNEDTREFLLAEFDLLKDSKQNQIQYEENRFSIFLIFLSVIAVGVSFVDLDKSEFTSRWLIVGTSLAGFLIGFLTFLRIIHAHINATKYARGLNRIRDQFIKNDPDFEEIFKNVLILPRSSNEPKLGEFGVGISKPWLSGTPGIINIINSFLLSVFCGSLLAVWENFPLWLSGLLGFVVAYSVQLITYFYTIRRAKHMLDSKNNASS